MGMSGNNFEYLALVHRIQRVSTCSMQVDSGVIRRDSGVIRIPEQLTQDDFWYDMGYENGARKLGQCVIINFSKVAGYPERIGTEKDVERIRMVFGGQLGFHVDVHDNLRKEAMLKTLEKLAGEDHSSSCCLCLFLLSHGKSDAIICSDGQEIQLSKVYTMFDPRNCKGLAAKPKLFFVQASRRDEVDIGVRHDGPAHTDAWSSTELLPGYDDFFGFYATSPGQHAYRDEYHGSFFIQTLCDVLERSFRFNDFLTMMTLVQFYVSEKEIPFLNQMTKQMPNTCSTLRKNLRFAGQEVKMGDELSRTQPCRAVVHSEQRTHSQERPPSPRIENSRLKEDGNLEIVSSTEIIWRPNKVQKFLMIAELMDDHHLFSAKFLMLGYMFHMRLRAIEGNEKPYLEVALFLCQGPNDDALTWPFNTEHAVTLKHPSDNDFYVEREAVLAAVHRYQKPESEYNVGTIFIKLSLEKLKKHGFIHDDALCLSLKFYPKGY
ncbi:caspase-7-like isoform X2 [Ornithodoros turicata]|uniref:caspase-7-like isoform X2 n=1 Tax=Ornithodoros turicata TaxID=34597 RepID=UPI00313A3B76